MTEEAFPFIKYRRKRKSIYNAKRMNCEYVRTLVHIRREIYEKLMELLPKVFDYQRGALSDAVNEALVMWINAHTTAHIKVNPRPDVREVFREVIRYLRDVYFPTGQIPTVIPRKMLEEAIMNVRKIRDPRSILNWLRIFCSQGLLKYNDKLFSLKSAKTFEIAVV
ncbi:MAG: hypothetical protein ACXQS5_04720 [Candidatus Methanospirareceae archaeon]